LVSVLPKKYWTDRGLSTLLNHSSVYYNEVPNNINKELFIINEKFEILSCVNPVKVANELAVLNPKLAMDFINTTYKNIIPKGINPFSNPEFLGKLIENKLAVLNHSSSSDLQARYILPVNTLLSNLLKFPDKLEKVKVVFEKTQHSFFETYVVFELLCYLEHYDSISKDTSLLSIKHKALYKTLIILKEFDLNSFDRDQITFNLETLSQLKNQYLALKDE
jgi:hypothetical protein